MFALKKGKILRILAIRPFSSPTIDDKELKRLNKLSSEWWDDKGILRGLQIMNKVRVPMVESQLFANGKIPKIVDDQPLINTSILDVGCGGGVYTEALAKRGANIIGLDPSAELLEIARNHQKNLPNLTYVEDTIENYSKLNANKFDVVVASETIEHVLEQKLFLEKSVECLKPGGSIFITTNNRTLLSKLIGIYFYENIAKCIPQGINDFEKFIHIETLKKLLAEFNCKTVWSTGLIYNPLTSKWLAIRFDAVWYALHAIKQN